MTNQDILNSVRSEAACMDKEALLAGYLEASSEVLALSSELDELTAHVEKLEALVSGHPEVLALYLAGEQQADCVC